MRPLAIHARSAFNGPIKTLAFVLFLPLVFLCCASTAEAVPVVITGGSAGTAPRIGNFSLNVTGLNFSFSGSDLSAPKQQLCGRCLPGTQFGGAFLVRIDTFRGLVYNGASYGPPEFIVSSSGNFIILPPLTVPDDLGPLVSPFSFVGGITVNPRDGSAPFTLELTGAGTATFTFTQFGSSVSSQAIFAFAPPAEPVPEPATLLLLGAGIAGVVVKVRRRREG